jgi:hypothetical protein
LADWRALRGGRLVVYRFGVGAPGVEAGIKLRPSSVIYFGCLELELTCARWLELRHRTRHLLHRRTTCLSCSALPLFLCSTLPHCHISCSALPPSPAASTASSRCSRLSIPRSTMRRRATSILAAQDPPSPDRRRGGELLPSPTAAH